MSKNQREFFYLIFQCFIIDEKIKNKKLFSFLNFKILPEEMKAGVIDLITEIKTLQEENLVLLHNSKHFELQNVKLRNELNELEEDFHFTMEQLNNPNLHIELDKEVKVNKKEETNKSSSGSLFDLKKQIEDMKVIQSSLTSKERALREENQNLSVELDVYKNKFNSLLKEFEELKSQIEAKQDEINSLSNSNSYFLELNNKIKNDLSEVNNKHEELTKQYNYVNQQLKLKSSNDNGELSKLKVLNLELNTRLENLEYEKQTASIQVNMFKTQKDEIMKEHSITVKESQEQKKSILEFKNEIKYQANQIIDLNNESIEKQKLIKILEGKIFNLEQKIAILEVNKNNNTSILDESVYRIGRDDYEEFNNYQRDKDEMECEILRLKTNNDALTIEIEKLKEQLKQM